MSQFDTCPSRRGTGSYKWDQHDDDVLPMWVADMDFQSPEPVIRALRERVEHGVFGYTMAPPDLKAILVERMARLYQWQISEEEIVFVPGVVLGFNLAIQALLQPGEGVLIQPPVYGPFLYTAAHAGGETHEAPLQIGSDGQYFADPAAFRAAIQANTRAFLLCNPHNPSGRAFRRDELQAMADACLERDLHIVSDEIHCDLVFRGHRHIPIASLSPEIAARTVTVMAPSKTFNIAGLGASFMIVQDEALRKRIQQAGRGIVAHIDLLAYTAMRAAYAEGQPWLDELLVYLEENRDITTRFVNEELPGCSLALNDATYLAWIDCRSAGIGSGDDPQKFFLEQAKVTLNPGSFFGSGGEGFVRFNFGCPRSQLEEALQRMKTALAVNSLR
ncbi:MAG: putative C-S lyase [Anaerolineae bacterium]|nr:putative C-S lyase [Anaerolineae bacterium]